LVEVRHGGGSYIQPSAVGGSGVHGTWHRWVHDHSGQVLETLEMRLGAEAFAASLAAQRAGPKELEELVFAMQAMREACTSDTVDTARFVECDIAFHDALLKAAGNGVLR